MTTTRFQLSVEEAVNRLLAWMDDPTVDARERIMTAHDLLDRGGLSATNKLLLGVVTEDPVEKLFRHPGSTRRTDDRALRGRD